MKRLPVGKLSGFSLARAQSARRLDGIILIYAKHTKGLITKIGK